MSVYVDDTRARYGRLKLCHMIADSEDELHEMADRIGVARKWYQGDHYDVCLSKRALAVRHGARQITWMQASYMTVGKACRKLEALTEKDGDAAGAEMYRKRAERCEARSGRS